MTPMSETPGSVIGDERADTGVLAMNKNRLLHRGVRAGLLAPLLGLCLTGSAQAVVHGITVNPPPPWAVKVFAKTSATGWSRCSGELIASRWVLTAAHCVFGLAPGIMHVNVIGGHAITVVKDVYDPRYTKDDSPLYPDLGLIELSEDVVAKYDAGVLPIAPADKVNSFVGRGVTFFGYGYTSTSGRLPEYLQKTPDGSWRLAARCPKIPGDLCFDGSPGHPWWSWIAHGDSGGAWVGWYDGGWHLLAADSYNFSHWLNAASSPSSDMTWIKSVMYPGSIGGNPIPGSGGNPIPGSGGNPIPGGAGNPTPGSGGNPSPSPRPTYAETAGGVAHTWTNYTNAGGTQGPSIAGGQTVQIQCRVSGFRVQDGNTYWYQIASSPWNDAYYVSADAFYNSGATSGSLLGTPFVDPAVPSCSGGQGGSSGSKSFYAETAGGVAHTWTNYTNAGGTQGPSIAGGQTVQIQCWVTGFRVQDGNTYWYQIASSPWNDAYYVSADAFYNNGATSGSLIGTPFVDPPVPSCSGSGQGGSGGKSAYAETVGGVAHTWTNYTNAGGVEGPSIAAYQTVQIQCRVTGFRVADGNTYWYQIASVPWSYQYYVSADAFYNNGRTSGSLIGTPFVDSAVPPC
jgi:Trypsin